MTSRPRLPDGRPALPRGLQKLLLVALGLLLSLVALALVEGGLALFGLGDAYRWEDPWVTFAPGRDLFVQTVDDAGEAVWATRPEKLAFFNRQEFPAHKAPGTYRIFALGGSTTFGRPYDARVAFARWLELYLRDADPTRHWEVVNAGAVSYASYRIVVLMRELVRYEPDLFVIYTGHNEFLEERTYEGVREGSEALRRLRVWLSGRRFYALARHAWLERSRRHGDGSAGGEASAPAALPGEVEAMLDTWTGLARYHRDEELARDVVGHFRANLERMAVIARDAGAGVVFVAPVSNLKDFSPFKSEHRAGLSPEETARADELLAQGRAALGPGAAAAGDPAAAVELLAAARTIAPLFAETHYRLGRALLALGRVEEAETAFLQAKDQDVAPLRAPEAVVRLVGETARREGVPWIDLPALLAAENERLLGHPILGNELFLDHVHPDIPTHSLIAERVMDLLVERGVARPAPSWTEVRRRRIYDRETASLDREYYARRDLNLAKVLGWAGKHEEAEAPLMRAAEVLADDPEVAFNLGVLLYRKGRLPEAEGQLRRALELAPGDADAQFNLGVVLASQGRLEEGAAALEEALRLQPDYPEAQYNLGVLEGLLGEREKAVAALERAVEQRPRAAEVHARLGLAYRQQRRLDEAAAALARALELDPGNAAVHTDLGVTEARRGRFEAAERQLGEAVRLDPGNAEAHYNLGLLHARRGSRGEAEAAYRRAIAADPSHAPAHNNLGILWISSGRLAEGLDELRQAVNADPSYAEAWFNLGVALDQAARTEDALEALKRAVELDPERPAFHLALGLLLRARGEAERAAPHLERAAAAGLAIPPG